MIFFQFSIHDFDVHEMYVIFLPQFAYSGSSPYLKKNCDPLVTLGVSFCLQFSWDCRYRQHFNNQRKSSVKIENIQSFQHLPPLRCGSLIERTHEKANCFFLFFYSFNLSPLLCFLRIFCAIFPPGILWLQGACCWLNFTCCV